MSIEIDQQGKLLTKLLGKHGTSTRFIEGYNQWVNYLIEKDVSRLEPLQLNNGAYARLETPKTYVPTTFVDAPQGRPQLPAECRLNKLSFTSVLTMELVRYDPVVTKDGMIHRKTATHRYTSGSFPAMVLSDLDPNRRKTPKERFNVGEPEIDTGGYFIVDGRELILQNVVRLTPNEPILVFDEKSRKVHARYTSKTSSDTTVNLIIENDKSEYESIFSFINPSLKMADGNRMNIFLAFYCLGFTNTDSHVKTMDLIKSFIEDPSLQNDIEYMLEATLQKFLVNSTPVRNHIDMAMSKLNINNPKDPRVYNYARIYCMNNYLAKSFKGINLGVSGSQEEHVMIMMNDVKINLLKNIDYRPNYSEDVNDAALSIKRRTLASIVLQLLYNKLGMVSITDRDDWQFKMIETAAMHMRSKMNEILKYQVEEMQRKINSTKSYDLKVIAGAVNKDYMVNTFTDAFRTNSWKRGKSEMSIILPLTDPNSNNILSREVNVSRVVVPASKQVVQKKRLIHASSYGFMCPIFTPEGAPCGLVGEPSITLHISLERDPNIIYGFMQYVVSPIIEVINYAPSQPNDVSEASSGDSEQVDGGSSHRTKAFFIDGEHHGFCDPYETKLYFDTLRRSNQIPADIGIVLDQFETIHIRTTAGRPMVPYLIVDDDQNLVIDTKGLWQADIATLFVEGCIEYIDVGESVSPRTIIAEDVSRLQEKREYIAKTCQNLSNEPNNASYQRAYESALNQDLYTHCTIDPTAIYGLSVLTIAGFNMSPSARATYGAGMAKQALITNFMRADYRFESTKTIHYAGAPLTTTQTNVNLGFDRYPSGRNVIVAVLPYGGANQEDGTIWNLSALQRGLFTYTLYHNFEVKIAKSTLIETFKMPEIKPEDVKKVEIYSKLDRNTGLVRVGAYVRVGDALIGKFSKNPTTGKETNTSVFMSVGKEGVVDEVYSRELPGGGRLIQIRVRQTMIPRTGDKMTSRISQKGVIAQTIPQYSMPYIVSDDPRLNGVVPHVIFNPHGYPSRMTMTQPVEMVIGLRGLYTGQRQNLTPFKHFDPFALRDQLMNFGFNKSVKVTMHDGITGRKMDCMVSVGPVYYQALPHLSVLKREGRSTGAVEPVTRQPLRGVRTGNALRLGSMEEQGLVAHGGAHLVLERLSLSSDNFKFAICNKCGIFISPEGAEAKYYCRLCSSTDKSRFRIIPMSYIVKTVIHTLHAANFDVRIFGYP